MDRSVRRAAALGAGAAALLFSLAASAQQAAPRGRRPIVPTRLEDGLGVSVGAGLLTFTDGDTRDFLKTGGTWEARVSFGTGARLGVEGAYFGSANNINALGLDSSAYLLGTGVEGDILLNLFESRGIRPYALVGLGWTRFSLQNGGVNTSSLQDSDNVGQVPIGLGVAYQYHNVLVDARTLFRSAFGEDLIGQQDTTHRLDTWSVNARFGWIF